ncbi:MAG: hypothetical protein HOO00_05345 [Rhodospirillaceae bacterium]|jgi:hypothetical protein|nr:hypothetical protein [Rhodospirillaceae bacterium]MBT5374539.1 hypothetical protein [Rhodospirillaceae bacterium]MBT5659462.1 hypothetical protein [Rhodospirillaceae bacterium]MBT5751955.1 hypothetical protein [Rhodospirillaceae bacterium]MBT7944220.1 hypothetical protein [Alphaproteobacteria bacterium]
MKPLVIVIHGLDHARAALSAAAELEQGITLMSAPNACAYGGPAWFEHVIALTEAEIPGVLVKSVLDCGSSPGLALGAIRQGAENIRVEVSPKLRHKIADIAKTSDATLFNSPIKALDLNQVADPLQACRDWLAKNISKK